MSSHLISSHLILSYLWYWNVNYNTLLVQGSSDNWMREIQRYWVRYHALTHDAIHSCYIPCFKCTQTCSPCLLYTKLSLQWRHKKRDGVWNKRKHQSSASLAFVRGIRRWLVNSPHKGPVENVSIWWRYRVYLSAARKLSFTHTTWWRHQMETFSALMAICMGNSPVPGQFDRTKTSDAELWCFLWLAPE